MDGAVKPSPPRREVPTVDTEAIRRVAEEMEHDACCGDDCPPTRVGKYAYALRKAIGDQE